MDLIGAAVVQAGLDSSFQKINEKLSSVLNKEEVPVTNDALTELVNLVPKDFGYPGLEFLALPSQTQIVLHQFLEATEIFATLTNMTMDTNLNIETPNNYSIRDAHTGVSYYTIKEYEDKSAGLWPWFLRTYYRRYAPLKFLVANMHTKAKVAEIESPASCAHDCCGFSLFCCCVPIPICCCLRKTTWYQTSDEQFGSGRKPIAHANEICTCGCDRKMNVYSDSNNRKALYYLIKRFCCFSCCNGDCSVSELDIFDDPKCKLGTHLGRIHNKEWVNMYEPSNSRYPPMNKEYTFSQLLQSVAKSAAKEYFTDADSYLIECPADDVAAKVGLLTATLSHDYLYNESKNEGTSRQGNNDYDLSIPNDQ